MADARHKKPPVKAKMRDVTDLFIEQVEAALAVNRVHNTKQRLKKGDAGYRAESHQDLSDFLKCDPTAIKNLLGGVRSGTQSKRPGRSRLVDPICDLLGIERLVSTELPVDVAAIAQRIAAMPPELRQELDDEVKKRE